MKTKGEQLAERSIAKGLNESDATKAGKIVDECYAMTLEQLFEAMRGTSNDVAREIAARVLFVRCQDILNGVKA